MTDIELEQLKKMLLGMNVEEQLEVSQLLLNELYENSETCGWTDKSFDADRVDKVIYLLTVYISNLKKNVKREEMLETLKKIDNFPDNKKGRVVSAALSEARMIEREDKQRQALEDCQRYGHIFVGENDGWTSREYSKLTKVYHDHMPYEEWIGHVEWSRKCSRCGEVETLLDKEPEVVTKAKEKIKRKERIAELEKELAELKKND